MTTTTRNPRPGEAVDRYGFPVRTCTRCDGSGRYSFNQIDGDRCYGCSGTGLQHTPKAAKAYAAWVEAIRPARRPTAKNLAVGDLVRHYHAPNGTPFAAVVEVIDSGVACGWSGADRTVVATYLTIVLDNGERWDRVNGMTIVRRKADVSVAPYLALV